MNEKIDKIEIMAPVGSWESLAAAIDAGADSVYFGVQGLNMRSASSVNFSLDDLAEIVKICNQNDTRTYLTLNTVLYDEDLEYMRQVVKRAKNEGVTAVIIADQAAMLEARREGVEVHISTQLNISNIDAVKFYSQWADVMVLARELNLEQVKAIYDQIESQNICGPNGKLVEIEMFAHGALCMAISGKCYLSLHEAWKSANRGACRQICRRKYDVKDVETGAELEIDNQYIMSPKDLCTIEFLEEMINAGVRVLKIEGRARGAEYVKNVCQAYKTAVQEIQIKRYSPQIAEELTEKLKRVFNRGFWGGYYLGHKTGHEFGEWTRSYGSSATVKKVYVGKVTNFFSNIGVVEVLVEACEMGVGDDLLITGNTTGAVEMKLNQVRIGDGQIVDAVSKGLVCSFKSDAKTLRRGDKVYKFVNNSNKEAIRE